MPFASSSTGIARPRLAFNKTVVTRYQISLVEQVYGGEQSGGFRCGLGGQKDNHAAKKDRVVIETAKLALSH